MKKTSKLGIKKVTLRDLDDATLDQVAGGTNSADQNQWCTWSTSDGCLSGGNTDQLGSGGMTCSSTCWNPDGCASLGTCGTNC